jgi:hypothetical protein
VNGYSKDSKVRSWPRGERLVKRTLNYLGAGHEAPIPGVTVRIALTFVGVVLFSVGVGLKIWLLFSATLNRAT